MNEAAFGESKSLKAVIFNSGVEWIDEYAFTGTPGAALIGEKGSYAEYYAQMSGMSFSEPTVVTVNGAGLSADVKPVVIDGVTYAPARAVMEALGLTVGWNDGALTGENEDVRFSARAGESAVSLNGKPAELAGPVIYCGGRAMIPLRSIAELLGAKVEWNGETNSVNISV